MSTFTQFNGPQQMPSTKAITELIDAYNNLSATLHKHMSDGVTAGVHTIQQYVDNAVKALASLDDVDAKLNALDLKGTYATKRELSDGLATKADLATTQDAVSKSSAAENVAAAAKLVADATKNELGNIKLLNTTAKTDVVSALNEVNKLLKDWLVEFGSDSVTKTMGGALEVNHHIVSDLLPRTIIDFCDWHKFTAVYAGTGTPIDTSKSGLYLIGMVSSRHSSTDMKDDDLARSKAGRLYIKVLNSEPLDCIVDFSVTAGKDSKCTGTIQAICSKGAGTWPGLKLHIVHGTDGSGIKRAWLGISCDKLPTGQNTGTLQCYAVGENCIPVGYSGYKAASNVVTEIAHVTIADDGTGQLVQESMTLDTLYVDNIMDGRGNTILQSNMIEDTAGVRHYTLDIGKGGADNGHGDKVPYSAIAFHIRPAITIDTPDGPVTAQLVSTYEANNLEVPVGGMLRWPATAVKLPPCYELTDGRKVPAVDYPDLAEVIPPGHDGMITLPNEMHSIIRVSRYDLTAATAIPTTPEVTNYRTLSDRLDKLGTRLEGEAATRAQADTDLGDRITAEETARTQADAELNDRIAAEDAELSDRIAAEEAARTQADTELGDRITAEEAARVQTDTELQVLNTSTNTRITKLHNGEHDAQQTNKIVVAPVSPDGNAAITLRHDIRTPTLAPFTLYTFELGGNVSVHENGGGVKGAWVGVSFVTEPTVKGFKYEWFADQAELINWSQMLTKDILPLEENVDGKGNKGVAFYIDKTRHEKRWLAVQFIDNADNYVYWCCIDATGVTVL